MIHTYVKARRDARSAPVHRLSPAAFWGMLAMEGLLLTLLLAWVLAALPAHTAPVAPRDLDRLHAAITSRVTGTIADPLIAVKPGVSARESNMRGLALGGTTYYYYIEGQQNFDPFSRGAVPESHIEQVLRDTSGPSPLVIYVIHE